MCRSVCVFCVKRMGFISRIFAVVSYILPTIRFNSICQNDKRFIQKKSRTFRSELVFFFAAHTSSFALCRCAVKQNVCYITRKKFEFIGDALNGAPLEKFIQWKRIDAQIVSSSHLVTPLRFFAANRTMNAKLYSLHKSFFFLSKALRFHFYLFSLTCCNSKIHLFCLCVCVFFFLVLFPSCHQTQIEINEKREVNEKKNEAFHPSMSMCFHWAVQLTQHEVMQFVFSHIQTKITQFFFFALSLCVQQNDIICKSQKNYFQFQRK